MPRGFLVKRSKRTSPASYRMREMGSDPPTVELSWRTPEERADAPVICSDNHESGEGNKSSTGVLTGAEQKLSESAEKTERRFRSDYTEINISSHELGSPGRGDASYSPMKPVGSEQGKSFFERCLSSPATAESFPSSASVPTMERMFMNHSTFTPSDMKFDTPVHLYSPLHHAIKRSYVDSERKGKPAAKKPKVTRKLSFEDEVTISPVLGLKIKKEGPESKTTSSVRRKPLGEFICQLCKEEYPDPFSLAQHKCSRIVRVEYRCPECDKVFSCPANLASHRRWHKPRSMNQGEAVEKKPPATVGQDVEKHHKSLNGKENTSDTLMGDQHQSVRDSSQLPVQQRRTPDDVHRQDCKKPQETSEPTDRHYKAAEKHFNTHPVTGDGSVFMGCSEDGAARPYMPACPPEEVYECRYCDKKFRRQAYLRKHIASHETMRSSYNQIESGQITFPCHLCGAHFPSAEIRDKHRLWHAVREELLVSPTKGAGTFTGPDILQAEQQIFTCKHCPSTFFSSPGLTRHINKAHPTENRQVMLLQMAVRPGC